MHRHPSSPGERDAQTLSSAYLSRQRIQGLTHAVYRYPARFSPEYVRACVEAFSKRNDIVLDPFVGGGTSAIESLAMGRRFIGFDVNPLAILLTRAKTTPLYDRDLAVLSEWIEQTFWSSANLADDPRLRNAPLGVAAALAGPVASVHSMHNTRQRDAARAVLLHVGQWAIDGRTKPVEAGKVGRAALEAVTDLASGIRDLKAASSACGIEPNRLPRRRILRAAPARDAAAHKGLNRLAGRVQLVVTSPPYPGVHVLYHRWQVGGRLETPMPYWLADLHDGLGPKHYTMGGRSTLGRDHYFEEMLATWSAIRRLLSPTAIVVQLVAFSDPTAQYDRYLAMMRNAGYEHLPEVEPGGWRSVPNRRWYIRVQPARGLGREILMAHAVSR